MRTREYIDKYNGMLLFAIILVPTMFIAKIYINIAGYLLDKVTKD